MAPYVWVIKTIFDIQISFIFIFNGKEFDILAWWHVIHRWFYIDYLILLHVLYHWHSTRLDLWSVLFSGIIKNINKLTVNIEWRGSCGGLGSIVVLKLISLAHHVTVIVPVSIWSLQIALRQNLGPVIIWVLGWPVTARFHIFIKLSRWMISDVSLSDNSTLLCKNLLILRLQRNYLRF